MEFQTAFQEMLQATTSHAPEQTAATACSKAGISPTADYYAGALQNVKQALNDRTTESVSFWKDYQLSLCIQLHRLEQETDDKQQEKKLLRDSIRTVQAILYALT